MAATGHDFPQSPSLGLTKASDGTYTVTVNANLTAAKNNKFKIEFKYGSTTLFTSSEFKAEAQAVTVAPEGGATQTMNVGDIKAFKATVAATGSTITPDQTIT